MEQGEGLTAPHRVRDGAIVAGAVWVAFASWLALGIGGPKGVRAFDDLSLMVLALVASALAAEAAHRSTGRRRTAWALAAVAQGVWALGQLAWAILELCLGQVEPFPSVADVGFVSAMPIFALALVLYPSAPDSGPARARRLVDALLAGAALFVVAWVGCLRALPTDAHEASTLFALAYPLGDVVALAVAIPLLARATGADRWVLGLLTAGAALWAVADSTYGVVLAHGGYAVGTALDTGWVAGLCLVGLAAWTEPGAGHRTRGPEQPSVRQIILAHLPVALAVVVTITWGRVGDGIDRPLVVGWVVIVTLMLARQVLGVSENHRLADQVASDAARQDALVRNLTDVIVVTDEYGIITWASPSCRNVFGIDPGTAAGTDLGDFVHTDDRAQADRAWRDALRQGSARFEVRAGSRGGEQRWLDAVVTDLRDEPTVGALVVNARDVTDQRQAQQELAHRAVHDSLTGLPNRELFLHHMRGRGAWAHAALIFLDLDRFKLVNDSLGHGQGDAVLRTVAARMGAALRPGDMVARIGGDEFVAVCEGVFDETAAHKTAARLAEALAEPIELRGMRVYVTASMGIRLLDGLTDPESAMADADAAMYWAKASGRARAQVFDDRFRSQIEGQLALKTGLHLALAEGELEVHYQPIWRLADGPGAPDVLAHVEALLRWRHPDGRVVGPDEFIGLAEDTGLIVPIGAWVIDAAAAQARAWIDAGRPLQVAVNLSARQLTETGLLTHIAAAIDRNRLPADTLAVEITESVLMEDPEAMAESLHALRALGIALVVDDFGTGYSSLSYLSSFPIDRLKVDQGFVARMVDHDEDHTIVASVIELAHALHMTAVAEGVETAEQLAQLRRLGCDDAQGYLLGRAMPADAVDRLDRVCLPDRWPAAGEPHTCR